MVSCEKPIGRRSLLRMDRRVEDVSAGGGGFTRGKLRNVRTRYDTPSLVLSHMAPVPYTWPTNIGPSQTANHRKLPKHHKGYIH